MENNVSATSIVRYTALNHYPDRYIPFQRNSSHKDQQDYKDAVNAWQSFLISRSFEIEADGDFGQETEDATKEYQRQHGLTADGIAGNRTLGLAMSQGLDLIVDESDLGADRSPNFPPPPTNLHSKNMAEQQAFFGAFAFVPIPKPGNREAIRITDNWPDKNIVKVSIPQLIGVNGAPVDGGVSQKGGGSRQGSVCGLGGRRPERAAAGLGRLLGTTIHQGEQHDPEQPCLWCCFRHERPLERARRKAGTRRKQGQRPLTGSAGKPAWLLLGWALQESEGRHALRVRGLLIPNTAAATALGGSVTGGEAPLWHSSAGQ